MPIKGTGEKRLKHLKGDNIETMVIDKSDELFKNFLNQFILDISYTGKNQ